VSAFEAIVSRIQNSNNLHIVEFEANHQIVRMMSLELSKDIQVGAKVKLLVKPTHIAIAKNFAGELSYANQLASTIHSIEYGELLCSITLACCSTFLEAIITLESAKNMHLHLGDSVTTLIKASELSIVKVY